MESGDGPLAVSTFHKYSFFNVGLGFPYRIYHLTSYSSRKRILNRLCRKFQTDLKCFVYLTQNILIQMADLIFQPLFIDRAQLFQ